MPGRSALSPERDAQLQAERAKLSADISAAITGRNKIALQYNALLDERRKLRDPVPTEHYSEARKLSGGNYYCKDVELWARAFESYVEDRLLAEGRKSGYLVHGTAAPSGQRTKAAGSAGGKEVGIYMEPGSEHRERTNAAVEKLIQVLHKHDQFRKALEWSAWFKSLLQGPRLTLG